jgi:hypothetical protein
MRRKLNMRFFEISKWITIGLFSLSTTAGALNVSVTTFYAPGVAIGGAASVWKFSPGGFAGRVKFGVTEQIGVACGVGYNDFVYAEAGSAYIPEYRPVLSIPMFITSVGIDYTFPAGSAVRPYVGGGGAFVRERAEAYGHSTTDWYPGVYLQGGVRYGFGGRWSVEAAPRYTFLFDEPAVRYEGGDDFVRSEDHSQLVEFLVGVNFNI